MKEALLAHSPETITEGSLQLPADRFAAFRLRAPAIGVSRFVFDELLARRASEAGADVRFEARVVSVERTDGLFRVTAASGRDTWELKTRAVIGAWGRWDALDRSFDRGFLRGRRFFGWSGEFRGGSPSLAGRVRLYLFRGGYCGVSRVEGGTVNLAGIVSQRVWKSAGPGWPALLDYARSDNRALDTDLSGLELGPAGFLGTGPVFFTAKPPFENGVLMVGDAAGVLDPFSGEGQSAALSSGILAAETLDAALSGKISIDQAGERYARAFERRFARRFGWAAFFRRLMLNPTLGVLAARLAGERLASLAIQQFEGQHTAS